MQKRILICDDDQDILAMIALILETEDLDLTLLNKSGEFFKLMEEVKPELVLYLTLEYRRSPGISC